MNTLGLFVKHPQPGQVKTRLAEVLGEARAARVYAAFVGDLTERFHHTADRRVLGYTPPTAPVGDYFMALAGRDYELWPQPDAALGERMSQFFAEHLTDGDSRVVLIGSDSPTLPRELVERAFDLLSNHDCVIGPATDGGYYLIGLRCPIAGLFENITWSGPTVLRQTVARLRWTQRSLALLPPWYDVDTPSDWQTLVGHVAALEAAGQSVDLPHTRPLLDDTQSEADPV